MAVHLIPTLSRHSYARSRPWERTNVDYWRPFPRPNGCTRRTDPLIWVRRLDRWLILRSRDDGGCPTNISPGATRKEIEDPWQKWFAYSMTIRSTVTPRATRVTVFRTWTATRMGKLCRRRRLPTSRP